MVKLIALVTDGALQKRGKIVFNVLFASGEKSCAPQTFRKRILGIN